MSSAPPPSAETIKSLIDAYYDQKPDFTPYIGKSDPVDENKTAERDLDNLHLEDRKKPSPEDFRKAFYYTGGKKTLSRRKKDNMPVHPAEEHASGNITDQVAKESSDSTASSHPHHQSETGATSGGSLGAQAHKAHPGPVIAENIGEPASKEELKKRAEELNK